MADSIQKTTTYFISRGKGNTENIARIVATRYAEGDIHAVVVASTSGHSALTIVNGLPKDTRIYGVNFQNSDKLDSGLFDAAISAGVVFMPENPVAKYIKDVVGHSPDSFRCFGQGMKVAVEVVMQAVEVGHIETGPH